MRIVNPLLAQTLLELVVALVSWLAPILVHFISKGYKSLRVVRKNGFGYSFCVIHNNGQSKFDRLEMNRRKNRIGGRKFNRKNSR